ncbi:hypothetical protein F5X71_07675 [Nocardia brasiliensis]|uniref:DUF5709 domain-containing protein n=1 Tax=Nocardia brasiliensis TaxID=37326 RepID=A0A6G9XMX8_NOCBR|nr:hypothetical protein [Nocardia brasiliensis]QIS02210.1 hypothetical protein F5X71_07675 [Nocardia brasiliensis]
MTESDNTYDPPQDTGDPDAVETDPAALSSAEDLDEDRLRLDPQEAGMDPPEQWSGATEYGMTQWEEAHPRPLAERLAEEQPDVTPGPPQPHDDHESASDSVDLEVPEYEETLGIAADVAGGSLSAGIRQPPPPE